MLPLRSLLAIAALCALPCLAQESARFEAPVELTADGAGFRAVRYPSPVLADHDGDGQRELIVGDLSGNLFAHEPLPAAGDLAWGPAVPLAGEGGPVRLHNW